MSLTISLARKAGACLLLCLCALQPAQASVVIEGTRIVYPAAQKEATVRMHNKGNKVVLMQVWADRGNPVSQAQDADAPFLMTPPIFRLDPARSQTVRVIFTGEPLPQDRESVFWFNSLEVPATPANKGQNYMQIAVRSRLKVFYRPEGLRGNPAEAARSLEWKLVTDGVTTVLQGRNPSPFHVSLGTVALVQDGKRHDAGNGMIEPFGTLEFALESRGGNAAGGQVSYGWISDYGAVEQREAPLR
ncbi:putative fimbrial chaperone YadV [compost metagenome]